MVSSSRMACPLNGQQAQPEVAQRTPVNRAAAVRKALEALGLDATTTKIREYLRLRGVLVNPDYIVQIRSIERQKQKLHGVATPIVNNRPDVNAKAIATRELVRLCGSLDEAISFLNIIKSIGA